MSNTISQHPELTTLPAIDKQQTSTQEPETGNGKQKDLTIKRLSIIIPAYNEENTIALIPDRISEVKHR